MSSHREAPEISKDPVADNTDVYAFVSPDKPDTVTLIANFIPFQNPQGGPNFYEFGDDVLYEIHVSNRGDAATRRHLPVPVQHHVRNNETFLYNTGPITSITDPTWNRPQFYSVTRVARGDRPPAARQRPALPAGQRRAAQHAELRHAGRARRCTRSRAAARSSPGQRAEGFHVDLGSIFDLGTLRPFQMAHLIPSAAAVGRQRHAGAQRAQHRHPGADHRPDPRARAAHRPAGRGIRHRRLGDGQPAEVPDLGHTLGGHVVARPVQPGLAAGQPAVQRGHHPDGREGPLERQPPHDDAQFAQYVAKPELARLLPVLYPGVFPNLAAYTKDRADLLAILLTGIPTGVVPGFQNYTGATQADMLRLNVAVPPTAKPEPDRARRR